MRLAWRQGGRFRGGKRTPALIMLDIATLQIVFYGGASAALIATGVTFGTVVDVFQIIDPRHSQLEEGANAVINLLAVLIGFAAATAAMPVTIKTFKAVPDHAFTILFLHFCISCATGGFPMSWEWWVANIVGSALSGIIGERLCLAEEMRDIDLGPSSAAGGEAPGAVTRGRTPASSAAASVFKRGGGGSSSSSSSSNGGREGATVVVIDHSRASAEAGSSERDTQGYSWSSTQGPSAGGQGYRALPAATRTPPRRSLHKPLAQPSESLHPDESLRTMREPGELTPQRRSPFVKAAAQAVDDQDETIEAAVGPPARQERRLLDASESPQGASWTWGSLLSFSARSVQDPAAGGSQDDDASQMRPTTPTAKQGMAVADGSPTSTVPSRPLAAVAVAQTPISNASARRTAAGRSLIRSDTPASSPPRLPRSDSP